MSRPWVISPSYKSALETLIAARHRQGLTQRDVAQRLGKPPSFIAKIENRSRRVDIVEFIALAEALGLEPSTLLREVIASLGRPLEF